MPNTVRQFNDFKKLISANTTRFTQPQNTLPRIINLLGTNRGGLVTCDGTRIISSPNGNATPVPAYGKSLVAISQAFSISNDISTVGLFHDNNSGWTVVNMTNDPFTTVGTFTATPGPFPPQIVQTMSGVIFLTGYGNTVWQWSGVPNAPLEQVTNTFNAAGVSNVWAPNTSYAAGNLITPSTGNGYYYMANPGGVSGNSAPTFPTTVGDTVTDGNTGLTWTNMGSVTAAAPYGGMHGAYHEGSIWLFGVGSDPPDTLTGSGESAWWVSDLQDLQSWNPLNQGYIGLSDGQKATGLSSMSISEFGIAPQSALVAFKEYSTYQMIGSPGASNFSIAAAQTNLGCVAPRTIAFMSGVGIIRMSHLGVAVFDGMRDKIISEEIRPYLFAEWSEPGITVVDWNYIGNGLGTFVANPPMYVMGLPTTGNKGAINRLFVYDLILQGWTIVDLPFFVSSMTQLITDNSQPMTVLGSASDGCLRRWQYGDSGWDTASTAINWSFRTPEVFIDPNTLSWFRWLQLRFRVLSSSATPTPTGVTVADGTATLRPTLSYAFTGTVNANGVYGLSLYGNAVYNPATTDGMTTCSIMRLAYSGYMDVYGSGQVEIEAFHFETQPKTVGTVGRVM